MRERGVNFFVLMVRMDCKVFNAESQRRGAQRDLTQGRKEAKAQREDGTRMTRRGADLRGFFGVNYGLWDSFPRGMHAGRDLLRMGELKL